ncbi:Phosphotyrosyl phosphatase activator [Gaertneriomyces semiglobifer]|nr:Phosphotyrosyl phosphatase activator [Gaertneriomyces semiglobifer]
MVDPALTDTDASHDFRLPVRAILTKEDLQQFEASGTYNDLVTFIERLSDAVRGRKLRDETNKSEIVERLLSLLDKLDAWVKDIPPIENTKSRFGNPAFQTWHDRLAENAETLTNEVIHDEAAAKELAVYLEHSFGDRKRIDYGTGHEAHFLAFLLCIEKIGLIQPADYPALVLNVFWKYIAVMRSLQFVYWLEPAGSHGVWGLDDYHFLPFLFGASQLADHKHLRPKSIHDQEMVDEFSKDYMYFACIKFINSVKTASLRWHSPMLDDISAAKSWAKISTGMVKMYKAEVLGKLPIMQHFRFGSILAFEGSQGHEHSAEGEDPCGEGHIHAFGQEFPECCGIRVPSAIAAAQASRPRPLPFD